MIKKSFTLLLMISILSSCNDAPYPKPYGYPRLSLPKAGYEKWTNKCNVFFNKPISANIETLQKDSCFFNISYPSLNAKVHCSYIPVIVASIANLCHLVYVIMSMKLSFISSKRISITS